MSKSPLHLDRRARRGDLAILKEAAVALCRSCRKPHPVAHRPLLDPWRLARACCGPAPSLPRSFPARDWTTAVAPSVSGPARQGRDGRGRAPRTGVRGDGSGRDIQPCSAAGRIAPTSSGAGRCSRPEPGTRPEGDAQVSRPIIVTGNTA